MGTHSLLGWYWVAVCGRRDIAGCGWVVDKWVEKIKDTMDERSVLLGVETVGIGWRCWRKQKNNTWDSNVVPHRSTNQARTCLTSLSRREAVLSCWYGRSYLQQDTMSIHPIHPIHLSSFRLFIHTIIATTTIQNQYKTPFTFYFLLLCNLCQPDNHNATQHLLTPSIDHLFTIHRLAHANNTS